MTAAHNRETRCIGIGDWVLDLGSHQLKRNQESHPLNPKEMAVLRHLAKASPNLVATEELLDGSWPEVVVGDHVLHEVIGRLRRMLGDDARRPIYIETLRKRGYRLIAPVQGLSAGGDDVEGDRQNPVALPSTVAILPFEDLSPAQDLRWLSGRLREVLLTRLSRIDQLNLIRASYPLEHYGDAILAGERLRARALLLGSVFGSGDSRTLRIQLVETRAGMLRWSADYTVSGGTDDPEIPLEAAIGVEAALDLRPSAPTAEVLDYARYGTSDTRAYSLWRQQYELKFGGELTEANLLHALELSRQTVAIDAAYVMGHVALGASHLTLARWRSDLRELFHARRALERAVQIDPSHPVALSNLAFIAGFHRDWSRVVALVEQAKPWTAVIAVRGILQLYVGALLNLGHVSSAELALHEVRRLMEIEPSRHYALNLDVAESIFGLTGDAHTAIEVLGRHDLSHLPGLVLPPLQGSPPGTPFIRHVVAVHPRIAFVFHYAGYTEQAREAFLRGVSRSDREATRQAWERGGWDAMLKKALNLRQSHSYPDDLNDKTHLIPTADILAALGERDALFERLERQQALFERYLDSEAERVHECGRATPDAFTIPLWKAAPYDRYVGDPRFQSLLDRYGVVGYRADSTSSTSSDR